MRQNLITISKCTQLPNQEQAGGRGHLSLSPAESVGAERRRLDRAGGPAPGLPRGLPACPLPWGVPAQPHNQAVFLSDVVESLPGCGGHPPSSFETWGHLCQLKKDPRPAVPEPLQRGAGVTARYCSTEEGRLLMRGQLAQNSLWSPGQGTQG